MKQEVIRDSHGKLLGIKKGDTLYNPQMKPVATYDRQNNLTRETTSAKLAGNGDQTMRFLGK